MDNAIINEIPFEGDICQLHLSVEVAEHVPETVIAKCTYDEFPRDMEFIVGEAQTQLMLMVEEKLLQTHQGHAFTIDVSPNLLESLHNVPLADTCDGQSRNEAEVYRNDSARQPLLNGSFPRPRELVFDQELEKCTPVTSCFPCVLHPLRPSTPEYEPTPVEADPPPLVQSGAEAQSSSLTNLSSLHSSDASLGSGDRDSRSATQVANAVLKVPLTVKLSAILSRSTPIHDLSLNDRLQKATNLKNIGSRAFKEGLHELAFNKYSRAVKYCILASHSAEIAQADAEVKQEIWLLQSHCHLNMALTQKVVGNHNGIIQNCTKALELDENNPKALYRRGKAYTAINELNEAEKDFAKAADLEPQNSAIVRDLRALRQKLKASDQTMASALSKMFFKK